MRAIKFETRISPTGSIQLPLETNLIGREVEVTILPKAEESLHLNKASEFIKKWGGFLKSEDADQAKFEYLSKKYK